LKARNKDTDSWKKRDLNEINVENVKLAVQMQRFVDLLEESEGQLDIMNGDG
jgi:hypothetical protein